MNTNNLRDLTNFLALTFACCLSSLAQSYPNKPIHLIVPFPSAGPTDIVGRIIGEALGQRLNQVVIVENKPGAGSSIGTDFVVKSPADGYLSLIHI